MIQNVKRNQISAVKNYEHDDKDKLIFSQS